MWSESLTIYDPAQEIADRLEAESEGDMGKCKTCVNGYPSVSCVNCGTGFRNYVSNKEENMKVRPLGKDQYRTLWIDLIEKCNAQPQEIEQLKQNLKIQETLTMREMAKVESLTADKDEQAGRIMKLEDGFKKLKKSFQWLSKKIRDLDIKAWAKDKIDTIDTLLGGKEDV